MDQFQDLEELGLPPRRGTVAHAWPAAWLYRGRQRPRPAASGPPRVRAVRYRQLVDQRDGAASSTELAGASAWRTDRSSQSDPGETMANVWTDGRLMNVAEA